MAISDMPIFAMLRTRMHWHQERQRLLAENVANADTPSYRPRDLTPLQLDRTKPSLETVALRRTAPGHLAASGVAAGPFQAAKLSGYELRPSGNAVNLEEEMIKVAANQMDYQAAATLYQRGLGLIKTAIGKR